MHNKAGIITMYDSLLGLRKISNVNAFLSPFQKLIFYCLIFNTQVLVSPVLAGLAVAIGVPILLFYVYGVVPVSLVRSKTT